MNSLEAYKRYRKLERGFRSPTLKYKDTPYFTLYKIRGI